MAKKNFNELAANIIKSVGGEKNVSNLYHCVTRLRFTLKDETIVDRDTLKKTPGVLSIVEGNGQFQVVIGNDVSDVFETIKSKYQIQSGEASTTDTPKSGNFISRLFTTMTSIFNPIIPALAGAGMLKALLVLLTTFDILSADASTYKILSAAGNAVFYYLPLFLAYSSAKTFKANPFISLAIVAALMEPNITGMMSANGDMVDFFGIPVTLMSYSGTVIPAILTIWSYSYVEKILKRFIPKSMELFALGLVALFIMVPLAMIVIGPIGVALGNGLGDFINLLSQKSGLLAGLVIGGSWTFLVMFGIHWGVVPIMINNIANSGYDVIRPMIAAATFASAGVALGVYLKSRNKNTKAFALSSLVPALLGGITEPIVYGLSVKYKKPLIAQVIAGAIAGAFMGAFQTKAIVYVFPALTTLPAFFGDTFVIYCIGITMAFVLAAVLTYVFGFEEELEVEADDFTGTIASPLTGDVVELTSVNDTVFSSLAMGDGIAVIPSVGELFAPASGTVEVAFPTGHAIGLKLGTADLLIHIGIDTVNLQGEHFKLLVSQGDTVVKGQKLVEFDLEAIIKAGYDLTTMIIVTNTTDFEAILPLQTGKVLVGDNILEIKGY